MITNRNTGYRWILRRHESAVEFQTPQMFEESVAEISIDVHLTVEEAESLASVATRAGVEGARFRIHTPLITLSKADIIRCGLALGLDYGLTHSCYDPDSEGHPCGRCDSCVLRAKGFAEARTPDPLLLS